MATSPTLAPPRRARLLADLLQLAWPMLIGQVAQMGAGVADTVMAGAAGPTDLAAVALGFSIWLPFFLFAVGLLNAVTARIARAYGARDAAAQADTFQQGLWVTLALTALGLAVIPQSHRLLPLLAIAPGVQPPTQLYLHGITLGIPAILGFQWLAALVEGRGHARRVMTVKIISLLANIPLNYIFIHGLYGAPRLGGAGCGWATGCVMWLELLLLAALSRKHWQVLLAHPDLTGKRSPQWRELRALLDLGVPIGSALFAESSIFSGAALLVGRLGATTLAAHQIALNYTALVFMVPLSLGLALTVKISHALGAGERLRARRFAGVGAACAAVFALCSAAVMLAFPYTIASAYSGDELVRLLTVQILAYAASFQLFDGLQVTAAGSLRGYHDTRSTMLITLFAYWVIGLPLGYALGFTAAFGSALGVFGIWMGLVAGLAVAALLLNWRLAAISR